MTHPEDIKPGDYIAVTGRRDLDEEARFRGYRRRVRCSGAPLKVLAISLPFIAVDHFGHGMSLDVRIHEVQKLNNRYARVIMDQFHEQMPDGELEAFAKNLLKNDVQFVKEMMMDSNVKTAVETIITPDENACKRCGSKTTKTMTAGQPGWFRACKECGFREKIKGKK